MLGARSRYFQAVLDLTDLPRSPAEQELLALAVHFINLDLQQITLLLQAVLLNFHGCYPSFYE